MGTASDILLAPKETRLWKIPVTLPAKSQWSYDAKARAVTSDDAYPGNDVDNIVLSANSSTRPSMPLNATATPGSSAGSIVLDWKKPTSLQAYPHEYGVVWRVEVTGPEGTLVKTVNPMRPDQNYRWTEKGLVSGAAYSFRIWAANGAGEGVSTGPLVAVAP